MKRRDFVWIGAAGVALVTIPPAYYYFSDFEYDQLLLEPSSLSMIWDSQTIQTIGKKYLLLTPTENTSRTLVKLLDVEGLTGNKLIETLEKKINSDFVTGKMVLVDGWILSVTEARQCALFSITQSN